jgi:hypothetical protein
MEGADMNARIENPFLAHPRSVGESYFEHARFAVWFSGLLALAASAALCHAILPFTFKRTASGIIARLHKRTANRGK